MGFLFFFVCLAAIIGVLFFFNERVRFAGRITYLASAGAVMGVFVLLGSIVIVPSGEARVATLFGVVQDGKIYEEGIHMANPLYSFPHYRVRRIEKDFSGEERLSQLTADDVLLILDMSVAWRLNPAFLDRFHRVIGLDYIQRMMRPIIRRAVRDAVQEMPFSGDGSEHRAFLASRIRELFIEHLTADLVSSGFSETEAQAMFEIYQVMLRRILPPQRILDAVSEKLAAEQDLARQFTLTAIAQEEANRRAMEGQGVARLFDELPEGFTPSDIRIILDAVSTKTRADAMQAAVSTGQVSTLVLFGDSAAPATIPTK